MLPIKVLPTVLRFIDDIDATVAGRLMRKKPWDEVSLTSLLCDLLDDETSDDYKRSYSLKEFQADLALAMPLAKFDCSLRTHEYPASLERWVTQSDVGMILTYTDHFLPYRSWTIPWLLQAKRVYPNKLTGLFDESSAFKAKNPDQHNRMAALNKRLGYGAVKYLLYCPRPQVLDQLTAVKLAHLRDVALSDQIFDYAPGLTLHQDLASGGDTLAAGVFVANLESVPATLRATHESIFHSTIPLSWFLTFQFANGNQYPEGWRPLELLGVDTHAIDDDAAIEFAGRLASGDVEAVREIAIMTGRQGEVDPIPLLPAHTLRINIAVGDQADPERRVISG